MGIGCHQDIFPEPWWQGVLHLGNYNNIIIISKLIVYLIDGYNNSQYFFG